jgi:2,3-bisphosphoglycerate-independent phosphoglycerate mutase
MTAPTNTAETQRPVVLCILDGWGHRTDVENNAIAQADTPTWDRWMADGGMPHALVETSGSDVGLPAGQMGNSEVGHMNIGAGRVVLQDLPQIDAAVADGSLATRPQLTAFIDALKKSGGACHMLGLLSPGGVHSHQDHMVALAKALDGAGIPVRIHAFLDGRDTPPKSAREYAERFLKDIGGLNDVVIATVGGRYYGMDRDNRWDRVEQAYDVIVSGAGRPENDLLAAIDAAYAADKTDEFVLPVTVGDYAGMAGGDGLLIANFRADRVRQIVSALVVPDFNEFDRKSVPDFAARLGMTEYSSALTEYVDVLFPAELPERGLGEVVASAGLKQLRIAETEKYAHVTFFLNGGSEREFEGETRILIPSPKVATYDLQPEMAAPEVTDRLVEAITGGTYDLIVVNYANGDMVGHTGVLPAAIKAAETIDQSLRRLEEAVTSAGGTLLVSADHGNCEMMADPKTGNPHTAHTVGEVPVVMINGPAGALHDGRLADLAPTVLDLMGLAQPDDMTGRSLLDRDAAATRRAAE